MRLVFKIYLFQSILNEYTYMIMMMIRRRRAGLKNKGGVCKMFCWCICSSWRTWRWSHRRLTRRHTSTKPASRSTCMRSTTTIQWRRSNRGNPTTTRSNSTMSLDPHSRASALTTAPPPCIWRRIKCSVGSSCDSGRILPSMGELKLRTRCIGQAWVSWNFEWAALAKHGWVGTSNTLHWPCMGERVWFCEVGKPSRPFKPHTRG